MADFEPQHACPFPQNVFRVVDAPWDPDVHHVTHHPRVPSPPQRRPLPIQQRVVEPQNAVFPPMNDAGDYRWADGPQGGTPPPVENIAARVPPQRLWYNDYYGMAHYHPPPPADLVAPHEHHDRGINSYVGIPQGVAALAQAIAPPAPEIDIFDYAGQAQAGQAPALLGEWPYRARLPNEPAGEVLRRLAIRYLNLLDSHVDVVHMEPGPAGGIRVVITLELADLL